MRAAVKVTVMVAVLCAGTACATEYTTPIVPIKFSIDTDGNIDLSVEAKRFVTFLGTFAVGANLAELRQDRTLVVIRCDGEEHRYEVKTGEKLRVETNGPAQTEITPRRVRIECPSGTAATITLIPAEAGSGFWEAQTPFLYVGWWILAAFVSLGYAIATAPERNDSVLDIGKFTAISFAALNFGVLVVCLAWSATG